MAGAVVVRATLYRRIRPLCWLGIAFLVLAMTGCVGRVVPPEPRTLSEPVDIYLLDHGRHASLVLPREQGGVVRYSYGDWRWYVEERQNVFTAASAMLWPTSAGLGKAVHDDIGIDQPRHFSRLAPEGVSGIYPLQAEAERVSALQKRLDGIFADADSEPVRSESYGLAFVPYARRYSAVHQSNLVVASWLRELDVEVQGSPWLSNWQVAEP